MAQTASSSNMTRNIAKLVAVLIAFFGLYLLIRAVMLFAAPSSHWVQPEVRVRGAQNEAAATLAVDPNFDPFYPGGSENAPRQDFEDAPETTLNLKLFGRITGTPARATIQTPDGTQKGYAVGQEIMSGVTLEAVNPDYVVISQNGALERLTIEDRGGVMSVVQPEPEDAPDVDLDELDDIEFDPAKFLSEMQIEPVQDGGFITGYRISARLPTADLSRFQLENGDIITAIGGEDITKGRPEFGRLFQKANIAGRLDLDVLRGGRAMNISIPLE